MELESKSEPTCKLVTLEENAVIVTDKYKLFYYDSQIFEYNLKLKKMSKWESDVLLYSIFGDMLVTVTESGSDKVGLYVYDVRDLDEPIARGSVDINVHGIPKRIICSDTHFCCMLNSCSIWFNYKLEQLDLGLPTDRTCVTPFVTKKGAFNFNSNASITKEHGRGVDCVIKWVRCDYDITLPINEKVICYQMTDGRWSALMIVGSEFIAVIWLFGDDVICASTIERNDKSFGENYDVKFLGNRIMIENRISKITSELYMY